MQEHSSVLARQSLSLLTPGWRHCKVKGDSSSPRAARERKAGSDFKRAEVSGL